VPAAKQCTNKFSNHNPPSIPERVCQNLGFTESDAPYTSHQLRHSNT
jgi:hypothetical protein